MKSLGICLWCATAGALLGVFASRSVGDEQNTTTAEPAGGFCHCADDNPVATAKILERLAEPVHSGGLEFADESLVMVVHFLAEEYKLPIQLDRPALEDAGLTDEERVSIQVNNVSLKAALRLLLKNLTLTYVVENETLIITTPEAAEAELVTCVYDVRDILVHQVRPAQGNSPPTTDYDPLSDVLVSCVATETWAESGGGEAEIRPLPPGLLVISQTRAVHEDIQSLLATIRTTLRQPVANLQVQPAAAAMGMGMEGMGMEGGMMMGPESAAEPTPAVDDMFD